ncbi:MAG: hypothetical protein GY768_05990 [Planctomycetaceae bacterium]|nr:hypothetical protein [Planctomycetaceae bacterium]
MRSILAVILPMILFSASALAQPGNPIERCESLPLPGHQVSMRVDGIEKVAWHYSRSYERPFFFPIKGPAGSSLTRLGHPGAENHDHHRSVWFAHHDVEGSDFWSNRSPARIRQKHWYRYLDKDEETTIAVRLGWYDGKGVEVMDSDVVTTLRPLEHGAYTLEIQLTCRVPESRKSVELGKTNFGFLAVRLAKSISAYFGDGKISNSEGLVGEEQIFGKRARWMDYSGSVPVGTGADRETTTEGITYFDHPRNPRYPTLWHVRQDGWMGASFCMQEGFRVSPDAPLTLRYLLHVHAGEYDAERAASLANQFAELRPFVISKSSKPHRQYEVTRIQP